MSKKIANKIEKKNRKDLEELKEFKRLEILEKKKNQRIELKNIGLIKEGVGRKKKPVSEKNKAVGFSLPLHLAEIFDNLSHKSKFAVECFEKYRQHLGAREYVSNKKGSGRTSVTIEKRSVVFSIPSDLVYYLDSVENKSHFAVDAIEFCLKELQS